MWDILGISYAGGTMRTAVVKWGNSQGIHLPTSFLQDVNIQENDTVDVLLENDVIVIKKARIHKTTKERLRAFCGQNVENIKDAKQDEISWGQPVGAEVW
jgi:antitoxin component of MazEF toxin-antitoxin module